MYIGSFLLTAESYIINWFENEGCIYSKYFTKISLKLKKLMEEKGGI